MATTFAQQLTLKIEPFDYSDAAYERAVAIYNTCWPQYPDVVADWKRWDEKRNPEHMFERYVVRRPDNGEMVATGIYMHRSWAHHPRRFYIDGYVHPAYQRKGIGKMMYAHVMAQLAPHRPISIDAETREDKEHSVHFLEQRGFELKTREHTSNLDLAAFDPEKWAATLNYVADSNIEIKSLTELKRDDPEHARKIYDLMCETEQDIPYHGTFTPPAYDLWLKRFEDSPNRIDDCYLLALDGDDYVGITMLFRSEAIDTKLYTGLTAVKRTHRRRGIATALKVSSLGYAKANIRSADGDIPVVTTENEINNPMYQINVRLGFEKAPDWLMYVKTIEKIDEE
ncbi:MAG: GNAT family N-acetyltransferase [Anaerolineae bacterium]|nr:GNAT family N-acetyltransferase [Anaerolineae bacterium]MCO5192446.1 GNAT family N-acetyltransferase [Anaerolineae bacterium]MCO5197924.1 GNAT family N-acetyltransferase [Anaerolineae bacterium]MCO5203432.1 GNAT family N-acetyltransferase [Anaerolineae bacterium]